MVVLGLLTVLSFLFLFLSFQSRQFRYVTHRGIEEEEAFQVARVAADIFWAWLQEVARTRRGCDKLFPEGEAVSPLDPAARGRGLDGLRLAASDFAAAARLEEAWQALKAKFPGVETLQVASTWSVRTADPDFLSGRIILAVDLTARQRRHRFEFPREFRAVSSLPRPFAKFTLFVREGGAAERFNLIEKGFQDDTGDTRPFYLYNTDEIYQASKPDLWRTSGWVFLGGASVTLNLDGSHPGRRESETFIFWPTLYTDDPGAELPYACTDYLGGSKLRVRFTPIGAMRDWLTVGNLRETLMEELPRLRRCSVLRLFGDRRRQTPTRVFGHVFAEYVLYATLIYDANGDSVPDHIQVDPAGTMHRAIFPLPRLTRGDDYLPQYGLPVIMTTRVPPFFLFLQGHGLPGVPPSLADLMPAYAAGAPSDYLTFMTKLASDFTLASRLPSYNALYDQMFDGATTGGRKSFPAPAIFPEGNYPNPGTAVRLPEDGPRAGELFRGDLTVLDPAAPYRKAGFFASWYESAAVFATQGPIRIRGGVPVIDRPTVAMIEGPLELPDRLQVEAPVVLVARQGVTVRSVVGPPPGIDAHLVLVSLEGDITIAPLAGSPAAVRGTALLAPNGTVRWAVPVDLQGCLTVRTLDPAILGQGGSLTWDRRFDLTDPAAARRGIALVLGPNLPHLLRPE
ncbi:MAG: hypothetical protein OZSIB_2000 [Candidatus Ozemobacter sibiricus]|jgi:hypothetical protein|uniref:Uncharacterized protein n=1 Tax=Candidatus Ozemobacter sibiricus TaxID=2268124 RepID=A0A367ZKP3_9BACT|nr:MAG: hypothetical protein OZSIB_2000 [Candidatus Ozemobacter sibiricus]